MVSSGSLAQDATSLPLLRHPHDSLREGLVTLKDGAKSGHPVEQVQLGLQSTGEESKMEMLRNVYGSGLPARMQIERQILERQVAIPSAFRFWLIDGLIPDLIHPATCRTCTQSRQASWLTQFPIGLALNVRCTG